MKPNGPPAKQDQNYICQRTRPQASRDGQMKAPPNAAFFPLALKFIERQSRKSFFRTTTAAAVADKQVTILNANLFRDTVRARDLLQGALLEWVLAHKETLVLGSGVFRRIVLS